MVKPISIYGYFQISLRSWLFGGLVKTFNLKGFCMKHYLTAGVNPQISLKGILGGYTLSSGWGEGENMLLILLIIVVLG